MNILVNFSTQCCPFRGQNGRYLFPCVFQPPEAIAETEVPLCHRIIESVRLEKTFGVTESSCKILNILDLGVWNTVNQITTSHLTTSHLKRYLFGCWNQGGGVNVSLYLV